MADGFTFPTPSEFEFIDGDRVNVTWKVEAPLIKLYEVCGTNDIALTVHMTNIHSYVWIATRRDYVEYGCTFMLVPFTSQGEDYGSNITSVVFGVSKRYTGDPPPISYNFANVSSTPITTTSSSSASATAGTTHATERAAVSIPSSLTNHGLTTPAKIGIGLGVALGLVLMAVAIGVFLFFWRRKSRQKGRRKNASQKPTDDLAPPPSLQDMYRQMDPLRWSQADTVISGASKNAGPHETQRRISELTPGDISYVLSEMG